MSELEEIAAIAHCLETEAILSEVRKLKSRIRLLTQISDDYRVRGLDERANMLAVEVILDKKRLQEIE